MAQALYYTGPTASINYTRPETDVAAGSVVIQGTIAGVDITGGPADLVGALTHQGTFMVLKTDASDFSVGESVYWNATANPFVGTAGTGACTDVAEDVLLGECLVAAGAETSTVLVKLQQAVVATS